MIVLTFWHTLFSNIYKHKLIFILYILRVNHLFQTNLDIRI